MTRPLVTEQRCQLDCGTVTVKGMLSRWVRTLDDGKSMIFDKVLMTLPSVDKDRADFTILANHDQSTFKSVLI